MFFLLGEPEIQGMSDELLHCVVLFREFFLLTSWSNTKALHMTSLLVQCTIDFFRIFFISFLDAIASPSNLLVLRMMRVFISIFLFECDQDDLDLPV